MPVTKGAGNPDWTWDETLLALGLLYDHTKPIDRGHPDVLALSGLLRTAPLHPTEGRKDNFRNPDGVALKLQNLWAALHPRTDPDGKGLSSSKTDRKAVAAFPLADHDKLKAVVSGILDGLGKPMELQELTIPDDEVFIEGRVITARHRYRDNRLRHKLLEKRGDLGLVCEVCDFTPPVLAAHLRRSFFEAHHVRPLADLGVTGTKVSDMALVCAGCHRFVHRLITAEARWVGIDEARQLRMGTA